MSELFPPRANPLLYGQHAAEESFLAAVRSGRLPHAWLIAGPRGIGKATLAYRFARFVLAGGIEQGRAALELPPEDPVFRRVAGGSHGDLLTLERTLSPDTKKLRGEIVAAEAREIGSFLRLSSAESGWRIIVIDCADDMNRAAANSVLKIIEEPPPQVLLLLVSHRPGGLLPTIRSRCRLLTLPPPGEADLGRILALARPDLEAAERDLVIDLAEGSAGRALELLEGGGAALHRTLLGLLQQLPAVEPAGLHAFAEQLGRPGAEAGAALAADLLLGFVARMVTEAARGAAGAALQARLMGWQGPAPWADLRQRLRQLFERGDALNLDRKQLWLTAFGELAAMAR